MRFAPLAIALGVLGWGFLATPISAATLTSSFTVSATIASSCQASTPATAFGTSSVAVGSSVSVTCQDPVAYNVSLSAALTPGTNEAGSQLGTQLQRSFLSISSNSSSRNRIFSRSPVAGLAALASSVQDPVSTTRAWQVAPGAFANAVTVTVIY